MHRINDPPLSRAQGHLPNVQMRYARASAPPAPVPAPLSSFILPDFALYAGVRCWGKRTTFTIKKKIFTIRATPLDTCIPLPPGKGSRFDFLFLPDTEPLHIKNLKLLSPSNDEETVICRHKKKSSNSE
ncbi:hypothetical protein CDAR_43801 [Caerostris darwini]|uniref:Uncharacterized protein n=1 Tax=Caerostris darwini TaxID=1538125 RepID=A0AAV4WIB6_9ARAC|nr:hypothetical protein CDAR_43801 [Caerostris darwini]